MTVTEKELEEINQIQELSPPLANKITRTKNETENIFPERYGEGGYRRKIPFLILNTVIFFLLGLVVFPLFWLWATSDRCSFFKCSQLLWGALLDHNANVLLRHGATCARSFPVRPT